MKTKIICTIGPASDNSRTLEKLILAGMSIARLNFSHSQPDDIHRIIKKIRSASTRMKKKIIILGDLQGPKIRIGHFRKNFVSLPENRKFIFTTDGVTGDSGMVSVDYPGLPKYVSRHDRIFLDDGKIELRVERVSGKRIKCRVIMGGKVFSRKGLTVFNKKLPLPGVTRQDMIDLRFGINSGIDWFAHSFVRNAGSIIELKKIAATYGKKSIFVVAKIEDKEGFQNIDGIIKVSDGVMVARGDLGVSVERALVPLLQKRIIEKCKSADKLNIVATQILESMILNPYPTRAEVNDVAMAVMQGVDYLLLSAETAVGKYPVKTTAEMARIISVIELNFRKAKIKF